LHDALQTDPVRLGGRTGNGVNHRVDAVAGLERSGGKARHISVHNAVMISFLRPVDSTAWRNSVSSGR
jgi:hypothetical protein